MKRTITHEYNELEEKLAASVAAMNFRFMNLCVKAEEMSLIPIRARVEGSNQNLENVAMIGKKDDYSFMIVPNSQDDMKAIALGISIVHPDFKQKEETLSVEGMVRNLSLFAANAGLIAPSHYVQVDLAWAKARRAKGLWDHSPEPGPTPTSTITPTPTPTPKPPPKTGDTAQPLLWLLLMLTGLCVCTLAVIIPARRKKK